MGSLRLAGPACGAAPRPLRHRQPTKEHLLHGSPIGAARDRRSDGAAPQILDQACRGCDEPLGRQGDTDARWTKKHDESRRGDKNDIGLYAERMRTIGKAARGSI